MTPSRIRTIRKNLLAWFGRNARDMPWRSRPTPYRVTVSEFMLQQTQVATVFPYFERWMKRFPDWQSLAQAREAEVVKAWEGLGYYSRARNLRRLAIAVVESHGGHLPPDPEILRTLPGIGPYTAGAIASIAFNGRHPLVDGNVERVYARLFDWPEDIKSTRSQKQLWQWAGQLTPADRPGDFNQAIMELGALVCSPRNPRCPQCPLRRQCQTPDPAQRPVRKRAPLTRETLDFALLENRGRIWLLTPGTPGRWNTLHRLPEFDPSAMSRERGDLLTFQFAITRFQITARLVKAQWKKPAPAAGGKWFPKSQLDQLTLPAPHRKALERLPVERR